LKSWLPIVALLAAGCSSALSPVTEGRTGHIEVPSLTIAPNGVEEAVTVAGDLSIPDDTGGRVPAVIVLHSCSGMTANLAEWAGAVNRMGFAAFLLDSFTARGVTEICTGGAGRTPVSISSRLADVYRALALLDRCTPHRSARVLARRLGHAVGEPGVDRAPLPARQRGIRGVRSLLPGRL
jgi:hypothetical protein